MESSPQKNPARPNKRRLVVALCNLAGLVGFCTGMGIVGYLISQHYDGVLTASLAAALTALSVKVSGR